jgi:hypothetical protein
MASKFLSLKALADVPKSYWPNPDGEFSHA